MSNSKYVISEKKFKNELSEETSYLELAPKQHSKDWDVKQGNAIDEYIEEVEAADPQIDDIYKLLEDYTARTIFGKTGLKILDVGCGIDEKYPKYASIFEKELDVSKNIYVGIDPIKYKIDTRKYPFICGRIEDISDLLDTKFDIFIFSTCLDHFENIKEVAEAIKKNATQDATCIFWVGLHDTAFVAEQSGSQSVPSLYSSLNILTFLTKFVKFNINILANFWYYRKRERRLKNNQALDNLHFHYFTSSSIKKSLEYFGEITDTRKIPGTSSWFYTVKIKP